MEANIHIDQMGEGVKPLVNQTSLITIPNEPVICVFVSDRSSENDFVDVTQVEEIV